MKKAANILSEWLTARGMAKQDFAERIGVQPWTLSRYLSGRLTPPLTTALRIKEETKGKVRVEDWAIPFQVASAE